MQFEFDDFVVDDEARELRRRGEIVHLSPKAFDLLLALIVQRPRALSKAELLARVWAGVFVSPASLATAVAEARSALGDAAASPRYIRTVHRHGYAFQAAVRLATARTAEAASHWLITPTGHLPLRPGHNVVGRDPGVDAWLNAPGVSRRHARIHVSGDEVTIEDLGSKNGTKVRGERLEAPAAIRSGDELHFGPVRATISASTAEATLTDAGDP